MFQPVSDSIALSQKIIAQFTDAIIRGELKPGDRIPPERELAAMFGVSRTAIRDAIKILSGRGILKVRHGVGIFVADEKPIDSDVFGAMGGTNVNLRDLFDIRKVLETEAAAWAAQRAETSHIERLQEILEDATNHESDLARLAERDAQFHVAIAEASKNVLLVRVMWNLLDALAESRTYSLGLPQRAQQSLVEHGRILDAIRRHDVESARAAMHLHVSSVEDSVLNR
ncbi:GntR family transcriptional regulator [Alicyclobacillus acidoterrestris]|uniref:FadR/GntR family transcriptional regulator n=1 Tax=Alicyclobacillus suci TaxID=2816080 RepID=UPI001191B771|nr:FadR/GntR family transcriptional regulator [Alicyclobacillus suci]GEO24254.1 GntR family transcriptional regulator [Alicyclobacillus acidoterrestris]